jgi:hypothetical protein
MGVRLLAGVAALALMAGSAAAQETADSAAVKAAVDYCLAVAEAHVTGAEPIATGPKDFQRHSGPYGALHWLKGEERAVGSIAVSPGEGSMCTVIANNFEPAAISPWFEGDGRYLPDNELGTALLRMVEGGGVRIAWSAPIGDATMIIASGVKVPE